MPIRSGGTSSPLKTQRSTSSSNLSVLGETGCSTAMRMDSGYINQDDDIFCNVLLSRNSDLIEASDYVMDVLREHGFGFMKKEVDYTSITIEGQGGKSIVVKPIGGPEDFVDL